MKKFLLFAFALLLATASMAQNRVVLLQESFDGASMPAGWSIDAHESNWSVSATNNAGGQANEMHLAWSPQFNGMSRLVSPAVDLTVSTASCSRSSTRLTTTQVPTPSVWLPHPMAVPLGIRLGPKATARVVRGR